MGKFVTCLFFLDLITLIPLAVSLSTGLTCDRTKQNPVRNDTSMAIVRCLNCRECPAGYEPKVPCGKIVGIDDPVGSCRPCPDGTYSPHRDTNACKICEKTKCFKHQLFEGKCEHDKHDQSRCLNKCENGYEINEMKTACRLKNKTTVASNIPKATPTMTTTEKLVASHGQASSGVNSDLITVVVIALVIGIAVIAIVVWYRCRKWKRAKIQEKKDENSVSTVGLLSQSNDAEMGDEFHKENCKAVASAKVMSPGMSPQNSSVLCINASHEKMKPPLMDNLVTSETPVDSPADASPASLTQSTTTSATSQFSPQIYLTQNPRLFYMYVPQNSNGNHMERLNGDFPYEIYSKICEYFDTGSLGRDWRALAGWLCLSVQQVERIKNQQYKTHEIIQIWAARKENDLKKFLQILTDKKMTQLVADINIELVTCRP